VHAIGWFFFDDANVVFPRGTNWEIHLLTSIEVLANQSRQAARPQTG